MTNKLKKSKKNIEHFSMLDGILSYLPFFVRYPLMFFLYLLQKSLTNPLYLIALFILFMIIKRVVKMNTYYVYPEE